MKTKLSQTMIAAALLGLFALLAPTVRATELAAERVVPGGLQVKIVTLTPKLDLGGLKPGDGVSIDPLAASLRDVLSVAGELPAGTAKLAILTVPTAQPDIGTPAQKPQARLPENA